MKFKRTKSSHLMGHTQVLLEEDPPRTPDLGFKIIATPFGIYFDGISTVIHDRTGLDTFAKAVGDSWGEYEKLKPKIERV